ncbi:hypothetical protein ACIBBG_14230 [Micromonospora chersina]|uniref:hypothetical protein n=1 Tax=Micromonospora chersina TaxID=47854 RepID=UPI0037AEC0E1
MLIGGLACVAALVSALAVWSPGGPEAPPGPSGAEGPVVAEPGSGLPQDGGGGDDGVGEETPSDEVTSSVPEESPSPSALPTSVGLVGIDSSLEDPRAAGIAATFDTYFAGINGGDYQAAASMFDPAGEVLDPGDNRAVQRFGQQLVTTRDSDVVLHALTDAPTGVLVAEVSFQSNQAPGYGPKGRPQETCTRWRIRYELSVTATGEYRILRSKAAEPSRSCTP